MSNATVCAWRVGRLRGRCVKRLVLRTPTFADMGRWLDRTRIARRRQPHTLWLEEEERPATTLWPPRRRA